MNTITNFTPSFGANNTKTVKTFQTIGESLEAIKTLKPNNIKISLTNLNTP